MDLQEKQLGQLRPADTTAASLYNPGANTTAVIKGLVICNTSSSNAKFRVFNDDDGTTYDETTALFFDAPIAPGQTLEVDGFKAMNNSAGNFAVRTNTANAITFTLYGAEIV
jgi:hypothetical protein